MTTASRIAAAIVVLSVAALTEGAGESEVAAIECGLYLAESTIPGAGLGIFAGRDYRVGQDIGRGDVCIPFIDMYW
jgi:hypothetical protein